MAMTRLPLSAHSIMFCLSRPQVGECPPGRRFSIAGGCAMSIWIVPSALLLLCMVTGRQSTFGPGYFSACWRPGYKLRLSTHHLSITMSMLTRECCILSLPVLCRTLSYVCNTIEVFNLLACSISLEQDELTLTTRSDHRSNLLE